MIGDHEAHVDGRRRLSHADEREVAEVALHRAALLERDLLRHERAAARADEEERLGAEGFLWLGAASAALST